MALSDTTGHKAAALFGTGTVTSIRSRVGQYRVYRQTLSELQALSQRELSDLGIHRSMIRSIAHEAAYKD